MAGGEGYADRLGALAAELARARSTRSLAVDMALEHYAFWCAEGLSHAEMLNALGIPWPYAFGEPPPSLVFSVLTDSAREMTARVVKIKAA